VICNEEYTDGQKITGQSHRKQKCKNRFGAYLHEKIDQFTSSKDQNDAWLILHMSSIKYTEDIIQDTTNWDSHRLND